MMVHMTDPDEPLVLRGRLTTFARRCGKRTCWCATGQDKHVSPALVFYDDGRTRTVTLRAEEVDEVAAAVARYDAAAEQLRAAAERGLAELRARRQANR
jgi:hypothetical protein